MGETRCSVRGGIRFIRTCKGHVNPGEISLAVSIYIYVSSTSYVAACYLRRQDSPLRRPRDLYGSMYFFAP